MYTDEPSAILKLKKGGKVKHKEHEKHEKEHEGHKAMKLHAFESEEGKSPKKPSIAERMKSMNPNFKKGGEVKKKAMGGMMGMPPQPSAGQPINQPMPVGMQRNARPTVLRRKDGGSIDSDLTKTTVKGNAKMYEKTLMVSGDKADRKSGTKGVKEANAGRFKRGGTVGNTVGDKIPDMDFKKLKEGGKYRKGGTVGDRIPADTHENKDNGKKLFGETIGDNEGDFLEDQMHSAKKDDKQRKTGGVEMGNAGGFRRGGKIHRKAEGGKIKSADKEMTRNTVEGGDWENIPADTTPKGKTGTSTGEVKESNAGGFKHGGHAKKKVYAKGGNVIDDGKAEKIPHHFASPPVANSLQSGTFKHGGRAKR